MIGREIRVILKKVPYVDAHFLGLFGADEVGCLLYAPVHSFAIVNTSNTNSAGRHWYLIFRATSIIYEIFDPLGFSAEKAYWQLKELSQTSILHYNTNRVQLGNLCGQYCITFAVNRLYYLSTPFHELLFVLFTNNLPENDRYVHDFITELKK